MGGRGAVGIGKSGRLIKKTFIGLGADSNRLTDIATAAADIAERIKRALPKR